LKEVRDLAADIVCLQEIDKEFENTYKTYFEAIGYTIHFAFKTKDKGGSDFLHALKNYIEVQDGIMLAVKNQAFEIIDILTLQLNDFVDPVVSELGCYPHEFPRTHNVALVAKLKHKTSGNIVNIVTTHLHWDPKQEHIKYLQVTGIMDYCKKRFEQNQCVLLVGDINCKPKSNMLKCLLNLDAPVYGLQDIKDSKMFERVQYLYKRLGLDGHLKWDDAYRHYEEALGLKSFEFKNEGYPSYTTFTYVFKGVIDHIFYTANTLLAQTLLRIPELTEKIIGRDTLPTEKYPSDHLPIMAKFAFMRCE
jgi:CCR4-NOT transcription complex subunit 6